MDTLEARMVVPDELRWAAWDWYAVHSAGEFFPLLHDRWIQSARHFYPGCRVLTEIGDADMRDYPAPGRRAGLRYAVAPAAVDRRAVALTVQWTATPRP